MPDPEAESLLEIELPQPDDSWFAIGNTDWALTKLNRFVEDEQLKQLLARGSTQLVEDVARPLTPKSQRYMRRPK
jgi:hypothetical protein